MQITRNSIDTAAGPSEWFTGTVYIDAVATPSSASRLNASSVHFTPGARTAWHTHPNGQTIWGHRGRRPRAAARRPDRGDPPRATASSSSRARITGTARRPRAS
jgi:hypothetical protein